MVQIEAAQTVAPSKPTDPRKSFPLSTTTTTTTILQKRFHVVLCYKKACDEDSGRHVAGWMRESLSRALEEHPLLAGRLRRSEKEEEENISDDNLQHYYNIVSNDSGVRLIEGRMINDVKLDDFVELMMENKRSSSCGSELVFWEDLLEQVPQFSPLFYVQVTNFSCGGYSIGISCSLLLADPFAFTSFLKTWSNIHNTIVSSNTNKIPTFYHPNLGKPDTSSSPTILNPSSNTCKASTQPLIFQIPISNIPNNNFDEKMYENLAVMCIDEAERAIDRKMGSRFSLFVVKPSEDVKVEICSREEKPTSFSMSGKLKCLNVWDDDELKLDKICFNEGNKSVYVSCWINSTVDEDSVMIIASEDLNCDSKMKVVVTLA